MAGYELITTASRPRTAVFHGRGNRLAGTTDDGAAAATQPGYAHGETGGAFADGSAMALVLRARAQDSSMSRLLSASS
jgi:hypothetical protein